jgi:HK97 family phage major capsid protein
MARMVGAGPLKRLGLSESPEFAVVHKEGFFMYMIEGPAAAASYLQQYGKVGPKEIHALLGTQGDLGGYLIPEDFRREVIKDLAGFAVMRNVARVIPTSSSTLVLPSIQARSLGERNYSSGYTGAWKPEGYVTGGTAPPVQNQPRFSQERIPVHVWQPDAIEISTELLADSAVPLDMVLAEIIAETRAMDEDSAFVFGDGIGKPLGLLDAGSGLIAVNSGSSANVTYDGMVDTFTGLPAQYRQNGRWLMSSASFGQILKLKDNEGRPIFLANEIPGNLWTKPMLFSEFMPDPAADSPSVVFGDFRYYVIADRQELRIQRLAERFAPNVGILPTARVGGQVVRKNAFRVLTLSA